jgi:hypothetical protein
MRHLLKFVLILSLATPCLCEGPIKPTFFGMHFNRMSSMSPNIPIGGIRLWGTATGWAHLCPTGPNCNWKRLDDWLATAKSNGIDDVVYTFGKTPAWASSGPHADCECSPPRDLSEDGGGSDDLWKAFVRSIVTHNLHLDSSHAKIKYWGIWNEPGGFNFWNGKDAQMVRMEKDAAAVIKEVDPSALVLTPEAGAGPYFDHYFAAGGGQYADIIAWHGYSPAVLPGGHPIPEGAVLESFDKIKEKVARYPALASKPIWNTEGSWSRTDYANWQGYDQAAAFVVRYYVVLASAGVGRVYWYMYDGNPRTCCGSMWHESTGELPAGAAYREVHKWLLGHTVSGCAAQNHIWTCKIEGPVYNGKIVWDDDYEKTSTYDATGFKSYRDITGASTPLSAKTATVTIGNKPIMLETASK